MRKELGTIRELSEDIRHYYSLQIKNYIWTQQ